MKRLAEDLKGLTVDQYTEAQVIFALTDQFNFFDTLNKFEVYSKEQLKHHADLLVSNYMTSGKKLDPEKAKELLVQYDFLALLKEYHLA